MNKLALFAAVIVLFAGAGTAPALPPFPPFGADTAADLFSPDLAGQGSFVTSTGSAPFSAVNPAQAGQSDRVTLNVGALGVTNLNVATQLGGVFTVGLLYPTRALTFGGVLRYYYFDEFEDDFPLGREFGGNFSLAKEVYPQLSLGAGINFGLGGGGSTLSGDLGLLQNLGNVGFMRNFAWALVLRNMGLSWAPTWFTPWIGITFDLPEITAGGKPLPLVLNFAADVGVPSVFFSERRGLIVKTGITATIAERLTLSVLWPGAGGWNLREARDGRTQWIPSVGIGINFILPSGAPGAARSPSDGDLTFDAAFKALYYDVYAAGAGITWYAGYKDDLPPLIIVDYPVTQYFSPNNDGKADYLEFPLRIVDDHYVENWVMVVRDAEGRVVRTLRNKEPRFQMMDARDIYGRYYMERKGVEVPRVMRWNGLFDSGETGADGKYYFTISASDQNGNTGTSPAYEVILKNKGPEVAVDAPGDIDRVFDPSGRGGGAARSSLAINQRGSAEDAWESGIYDSRGVAVRTFAPQSGSPRPQVWDGRTDGGEIAPDGVYSYRISATDRAMNTKSAVMDNIIVDTRSTGAFLTASANAIAPKTNQSAELVRFRSRLTRAQGVESWKLELRDDKGDVVRSWQGRSNPPPEYTGWNGLDERGLVREGLVYPELTVAYSDGGGASAKSTPVLVNSTGPRLAVSSSPDLFSPDGDGVNDLLYIRVTVDGASPAAVWSLDIYEPDMEGGGGKPGGRVFKRFEGSSAPAGEIIWDGRGGKGELAESAVNYPYVFTASDSLGNGNTVTGVFSVDILVLQDGDKYRIRIPSIMFPPDTAVFDGLDQNTLDNNARIIKRLSEVLNRFRGFSVQVEGHANPTTAPGPDREREEPSLQALSEKRAAYVVEQLIRSGVSRNRLSSTGEGGSRPVVPYEDRAGWWKNRRVEFILVR